MTLRTLAASTAAIWGATLAGAAVALAGVHTADRQAPHDALAADLGSAIALLAHNVPVTLWPLALVAIGWPALAGVRVLGDLLVAGQLIVHGLLVGSLVAPQPELWRYLPHLPIEWLAIATPAAAWAQARTEAVPPASRRQRLVLPSAASLAALVGAAVIETYLVPVR